MATKTTRGPATPVKKRPQGSKINVRNAVEKPVPQPAEPEAPKKAGELIGYARTSTVEQVAGLAAQERDLKAAGCGKMLREQVSSVAKRPELDRAIEWAREGDALVVTKLDRLARSVADLMGILKRLEGKGVGLIILSMGGQAVDTRTPTGRLTVTMLGAVAEFERSMMLERQREGIAKAKADGKYKGRAPTARAKAEDVRRLKAEGVKPADIARRLGIGRASVYRALAEAG